MVARLPSRFVDDDHHRVRPDGPGGPEVADQTIVAMPERQLVTGRR
jgi:hypothetical protein